MSLTRCRSNSAQSEFEGRVYARFEWSEVGVAHESAGQVGPDVPVKRMFFFPLVDLLAAAVIVRSRIPGFVSYDVRPLVRTSHPSGSRHGKKPPSRILSAPGTRTCPRKLSVPRRL